MAWVTKSATQTGWPVKLSMDTTDPQIGSELSGSL